MEFPDQNPTAAQLGIHPQLAALETIVYPTSSQLQSNNSLAQAGTLEIAPMQAPLTLLIWSKHRVLPVRLTDFSITEEAFDPALNPIRAKVSLGMRVLSVNDLDFDHRGNSLFMAYLQQKERLAASGQGGDIERPRHQPHPMRWLYVRNHQPLSQHRKRPSWRRRTAEASFTCAAASFRHRTVFALLLEHTVTEGDRLDNIAARYLGDPEQFWRICDANGVMRPDELTETVGRRLRITMPEGIPGVPNA